MYQDRGCCKGLSYLLLFLLAAVTNDAFLLDKTKSIGNKKSEIQSKNSVEPPLRIGSFNIQTLAKKKLKDANIMTTIAQIIHRYDIIFIMELQTDDPRLLQKFVFDINKSAPDGVVYNMTHSGKLIGNEISAFFYRSDKTKILKSEFYHDPEHFFRTPFLAVFETPTLRDMKKFGAIGLHVKPSESIREINALASVYDYMKIKYKMEDVLLMGDFNADCDYLSEAKLEKVALWTRPEFTWVIGHHIDTTTNFKSCALDRFVYAGENMNAGVIMESAGIFNYQSEFFLTTEEVRAISDHWPIEVQIRGKTSEAVDKYLASETCFKIYDSRSRNVSRDIILKQSKMLGFGSAEFQGILILKKSGEDLDVMLDSLKRLRNALPAAISMQLVGAAIYKAKHNTLRDESSYADEPDIVLHKIQLVVTNSNSSLAICRETTIN